MKRQSKVRSTGQENPGLEMTDGVFSQSVQRPTVPTPSMTSVGEAVCSVTQRACYAQGRWRRAAQTCVRQKPTGECVGSKYKGLAWDEDVVDGPDSKCRLNRMLLDHFRVLASSNEDTDEVDLQYLHGILTEGADPNAADRYGQTALHEISRAWNVDVMRFFLEMGADMQRPDAYGVTPLHVAAALDYEEMVSFLLTKGAALEACTQRDQQTPLHFAAKNDAVGAIRVLLQSGADITARDHKRRTPLHLASNLDRGEAARALLASGADAGVQDCDGQLCITAMIGRMSPVANLAMNQFHVTDRMTRKQFYYLHLLEPEPVCKKNSQGTNICSEPISPLESIVRQGRLELIMHPVVQKLIQVKWNLYGRFGAWTLLLLNFLFIVSWTVVAVSVSVTREDSKLYIFPQDWWRVVVVVAALVLTVWEVYREVMEVLRSRRKLRRWQAWSIQRLHEDLACTHPMWPEEYHFIEDQIKLIRHMKGNYLQDLWNIFDWLVYSLLMVVLGLHLANVFVASRALRENSLRLFAVAIIFLWLRLMKHVRAFRVMGPFIVMLGEVVGDVLRFLFLYAEIYIPYACAFWIIFGGTDAVPNMQTVPQLLYSLYRITLVDDYQFDAMLAVDSIMAQLLCGTFLALSAVLCVNLLIALLSDTFQRVYDNALANAVMQQAAIILQVEESMSGLRRCYDDNYIHRHCAPLAQFYDDSATTDPGQDTEMKSLTVQIKDTLDKHLEIQRDKIAFEAGQAGSSNQESHGKWPSSPEQGEHLHVLRRLCREQQQHGLDLRALRADVRELQALLLQLTQAKSWAYAESNASSPVQMRGAGAGISDCKADRSLTEEPKESVEPNARDG